MAAGNKKTRRSNTARMLGMGLLSVALYGLLLSHQDVVNDFFTRGGLYAFLPVGVAFLFSFVHGTFTGSFWSFLGIEASKRKREVK